MPLNTYRVSRLRRYGPAHSDRVVDEVQAATAADALVVVQTRDALSVDVSREYLVEAVDTPELRLEARVALLLARLDDAKETTASLEAMLRQHSSDKAVADELIGSLFRCMRRWKKRAEAAERRLEALA